MKLLIVESPTKARTLTKYLPDDYTIFASVGHIKDIPKSDKDAIDIENGYEPNYVVVPGKEQIVADIKREAKKADEILLATDPDREGEAIAWHLKEIIDRDNVKRVTFNEITEEAVQEAVKNPKQVDENLKTAQVARRVLDRLFGYSLSRLIWEKVRYGLSAGRVQSPALRIIMEREREIRAFNPEQYWNVKGIFTDKNKKNSLEMQLKNDIFDQKEFKEVEKNLDTDKYIVSDIKVSEVNKKPYAPFTTSTLQQSANSRLNMSTAQTMMFAQRLYEAGHITYMRTDSISLSQNAISSISSVINKKFGKKYSEPTQYKTKKKNAQEAHEAIRPTNFNKSTAGTTQEQKNLYKLIYDRTVSSQMKTAKIERTTIHIKGEKIPVFTATASKVLFDGWMAQDTSYKNEEQKLPNFKLKEEVLLKSYEIEEKETTPPNRFSEAGLVKELEKRGIGRPSTYASIIKTLVDRNYCEREGRTLIPTDTGDVVSSFIEDHFSKYITDDFTSHMEDNLDLISEGKGDYFKTIDEFYKNFVKEIAKKKDIEKLTTLRKAEGFQCPKCEADMVFKLSKTGTFMSCEKFPDCTGARTKEGEEIKDPEKIGETCPKCEKGDLVRRMGRFGEFISCDKYPKCKYVREDEKALEKASTGVSCIECKDGKIIERKGRFGVFYGCSGYPDCNFTMRAKPTGKRCELCNGLMMEGTKTIPERCSIKTCPYHNPHKIK